MAAVIQQQREAQRQQPRIQQQMKQTHRDLNAWTRGLLQKWDFGAAPTSTEACFKFFAELPTRPADNILEGLGAIYDFVTVWDADGAF